MANQHINLPNIDAPPPTAPLPTAPPPPLTPEQLSFLQDAGGARRAIRKTAAVASFSGITSLVLGIGAAGCLGLSHDLAGILATLVLLTVGTVELVGRHRLLQGQANALRILSINQLAFLAAIGIYCGVQIATFSAKSLTANLDAEVKAAGGGMDVGSLVDPQLARTLNTSVYGLVFLVSIASQGGLALYYRRRKKYLDAYRTIEPWQRDLLQKVSG